MLQRWITALIGIPIFIWIIITPFGNGLPYLILTLVSGLVLNIEVMNMVQKTKKISYNAILMSLAVTISILNVFLLGIHIIPFTQFMITHLVIFMVYFYIIVGKELISSFEPHKNFEVIGFNLLIYISLVIFFPLLILIKHIIPNSIGLIILFMFTWISDAVGLFTGKLVGNTPLEMLPSKSKTLEGYFGSLIFTTLLGVLFFYIQGTIGLPFHWSLLKWGLFGITMSFSANFGDLIESLIKRWTNVKDSGSLLPGMGGLFDAIDSQIYSVVTAMIFFL